MNILWEQRHPGTLEPGDVIQCAGDECIVRSMSPSKRRMYRLDLTSFRGDSTLLIKSHIPVWTRARRAQGRAA